MKNQIGSPATGNSTLVLVLGVVSVFLPVLGPMAWSLGNNALASGVGNDPSSAQQIAIGRILGTVGTGLLILYLLVFIVAAGFMGAMWRWAYPSMHVEPR